MRDVQKGATLLYGGTWGCPGVPSPIFYPFQKWKGIKGMVSTYGFFLDDGGFCCSIPKCSRHSLTAMLSFMLDIAEVITS